MEPIHNNQLLRIQEVSALTSLAKSTINLWVAQGKFPKPISLSLTIKVWRTGDLVQWIESQATSANHLREMTGANEGEA